MNDQPSPSGYSRPLKTNALLLLLLTIAYGIIRLAESTREEGQYPELWGILFFGLTFYSIPVVNFSFFIHSYYKHRRSEAKVYGVVVVLTLMFFLWLRSR